ncbi:energy transducer TonB [Rhodanobacter sp. OR87]|uniref:energy transducer TonB n=1 Tax=Rhodanobacter sp. OR87 TaxID=1076523 RepID=UPI0003F76F02|nr:energy transducer TonB [Rhodanobacter sp. OR87]
MSSASLAVAHRTHPDRARIAAISAAIALNLAVIVIASRPTGPAFFHAIEQINPIPTIHFVEPTPPLPPPPPVATPTLLPSATTPGPALTAPVEASLAYRSAPLRFPTRALQQRMQGTVLLRVLVDETGKPVQVSVEHGSGYLLLDHSAVEQVLAGWQFQPAMVNGRAVRAWARVPVTFDLRE